MTLNTAYIVDFDGTITTRDLSFELAAHFGAQAFLEINREYRLKKIPIRLWLQGIVKLLPGDMGQLYAKVFEWAEIRPGFEQFLEYAHKYNCLVIVASDGFGFYIEPILEHFGLRGKIDKIYRNNTFINRNGRLEVSNPHAHAVCPVCGNCKAAHVVGLKNKGLPVIYIGDGSNDRFGASWSDHVCARGKLAEICIEKGFTYSQWNDFYDIIKVDKPELKDRSAGSLCCPMGSGIKT